MDDPLAREHVPASERDSNAECETAAERDSDAERGTAAASASDTETASVDNVSAAAKHPVPGDRKQARECPEPAAADGTPGWRELLAEDLCAFTPNPAECNPEKARGTEPADQEDEESSELRDWFWDSGEPPPF